MNAITNSTKTDFQPLVIDDGLGIVPLDWCGCVCPYCMNRECNKCYLC